MAVDTGLLASEVLSTLPSPTSAFTNTKSVFTCAGVRLVQAPALRWIRSSFVGVSAPIA